MIDLCISGKYIIWFLMRNRGKGWKSPDSSSTLNFTWRTTMLTFILFIVNRAHCIAGGYSTGWSKNLQLSKTFFEKSIFTIKNNLLTCNFFFFYYFIICISSFILYFSWYFVKSNVYNRIKINWRYKWNDQFHIWSVYKWYSLLSRFGFTAIHFYAPSYSVRRFPLGYSPQDMPRTTLFLIFALRLIFYLYEIIRTTDRVLKKDEIKDTLIRRTTYAYIARYSWKYFFLRSIKAKKHIWIYHQRRKIYIRSEFFKKYPNGGEKKYSSPPQSNS